MPLKGHYYKFASRDWKTEGPAGKMLGGIWVSDDEGETWRYLSRDMKWASAVSLAFGKDEKVLYMGTFNWFENYKNTRKEQVHSGGLFKSEDGGETWKNIFKSLDIGTSMGCQSVTVNPDNNNIVYAGINYPMNATMTNGIFKSKDGGKKWVCINNNMPPVPVSAIVVSHFDPSMLYVATVGADGWLGVDQHVK